MFVKFDDDGRKFPKSLGSCFYQILLVIRKQNPRHRDKILPEQSQKRSKSSQVLYNEQTFHMLLHMINNDWILINASELHSDRDQPWPLHTSKQLKVLSTKDFTHCTFQFVYFLWHCLLFDLFSFFFIFTID